MSINFSILIAYVCVGIFVSGPANLISSAISADLGKQVCTYVCVHGFTLHEMYTYVVLMYLCI